MRAIHLLTPEYLPTIGGVADYTRQIARGLTEAGEEVHVWCPAPGAARLDDVFVVHPVLGQFRGGDLERAGTMLDAFPGPRRILVQWVPHGYGRRAMNLPFCLWLWKRARAGDRVELIVHEPYLAFWEGSWRQTAAAAVHRLMTAVLLRAATRVWMSVPAWERMWRPYAFGRAIPFTWLPIPSNLGLPDPDEVTALRATLGAERRPLVGHLGTYGSPVALLLKELLPALLGAGELQVLLIGAGSERFRAAVLADHPDYSGRLLATGALSEGNLAVHVAACDVLVQPYPDGLSSRRTTAMAGLRLGVPIVTTRGYLTEPLWEDSKAVRLTPVGDARGMAEQVVDLLEHAGARKSLGRAGRDLYDRLFDVSRTVVALTSAGKAA